jgi:hypothetical protein
VSGQSVAAAFSQVTVYSVGSQSALRTDAVEKNPVAGYVSPDFVFSIISFGFMRNH